MLDLLSQAVRPPLVRAAFLVALAALGGCRDNGDVTGAIPASQTLPTSEGDLRAYADELGKKYDANPGEKSISIQYAAALRALTRYGQAAAVMQTAAVKAPQDMQVLGAYGKALADAGQLAQADDVLSRSYTEERPNWSSLSVRGSIADQMGDHAKAQGFYRDALKLAPGEPSVLSNLGLSYALNKQLTPAEQALREAATSPRADARVRDNLALVLSLEGKFGEAEEVSRRDRSPQAASANVASIRQVIAQSNSWREIQAQDARKRPVHSATIPVAAREPVVIGQPAERPVAMAKSSPAD